MPYFVNQMRPGDLFAHRDGGSLVLVIAVTRARVKFTPGGKPHLDLWVLWRGRVERWGSFDAEAGAMNEADWIRIARG